MCSFICGREHLSEQRPNPSQFSASPGAHFHPEASEESWLCSRTKSKAAIIYSPGSLLGAIISAGSAAPKVTLISSVTRRVILFSMWVTESEINFLTPFSHPGGLLLSSTTAEIKPYLLLQHMNGRWLFVFSVIEFPLDEVLSNLGVFLLSTLATVSGPNGY